MPLQRRQMLGLALAGAGVAHARVSAAPAELAERWPQLRLVGSGRLRWFGLRIVDARLWAPGPLSAADWPQQAFALELQYARSLEGAAIAQRSLDEMRRQGPMAPGQAERWLATMSTTFPDVRDGDRLTGSYEAGVPARFHFNGGFRGEWRDAALARQFFAIWLAPQTSDPALREALFGGRA